MAHETDKLVDIANDIQRVCAGQDAALVYAAISMVLGAAAASAKRPDFDGLMRLVDVAAREEFDRRRAN